MRYEKLCPVLKMDQMFTPIFIFISGLLKVSYDSQHKNNIFFSLSNLLSLHESSQKFLKAGFSKLKKNQNSQTHTLRVMVMVMVGVHNISILRTCCVSVLPFFGKKITHSKVTKSLENHTLYTLG